MSIREPPLKPVYCMYICSDAKVPSWTGAVDRAAPREQPTTQKSMFEQVQKNQMDEEEMKGRVKMRVNPKWQRGGHWVGEKKKM